MLHITYNRQSTKDYIKYKCAKIAKQTVQHQTTERYRHRTVQSQHCNSDSGLCKKCVYEKKKVLMVGVCQSTH